ncbi:MAG: hypothetical protein LBD12_02145 [Clostridiales Family XIII bacterium]|jgi:hypothetical protein|nr:hypothetical protein [Clostridiales Family XIII bacterium]
MIWSDFYHAYFNWDDDAKVRNMPSADALKAAPTDEVFEVFEDLGDEGLRAALLKNAMAAGIRFEVDQVLEMVYYLPKDMARELFLLYADRMSLDELFDAEWAVDDAAFTKALMDWALSGGPVKWKDYYAQGTSWDFPDEVNVARLALLEAFGRAGEVYDFGAYYFSDDTQRSLFVEKALAAGVRFDFEQTYELMCGVRRETANRLYWAYGKKLSEDDLYEIEGLVDKAVYEQARRGVFFSNKPIDWQDFVDNIDEWDDDVKLHKASCLTSFGDAEEVAEAAESFRNKKMAARFVEMACDAGVDFPQESRKTGGFAGLLQAIGGVLIADRLLRDDKKDERHGGAMGGGVGVERPDIFGGDSTSIFDNEAARDEYYRRIRQERYESGLAEDEFEPIE